MNESHHDETQAAPHSLFKGGETKDARRKDDQGDAPYAYVVSLSTVRSLYQDVVVHSPVPLSRQELIQKAIAHAGTNWEQGEIDRTIDVNDIQEFHAPERGTHAIAEQGREN